MSSERVIVMDSEHAPELAEEIRRLQDAYEMYRTTMFKILDVGRPGVTALINALRDRITDPIAVALGCAFGRDTPGAEEAVLPLLVFMQRTDRSYGFVVEALARAGEKCIPHWDSMMSGTYTPNRFLTALTPFQPSFAGADSGGHSFRARTEGTFNSNRSNGGTPGG